LVQGDNHALNRLYGPRPPSDGDIHRTVRNGSLEGSNRISWPALHYRLHCAALWTHAGTGRLRGEHALGSVGTGSGRADGITAKERSAHGFTPG